MSVTLIDQYRKYFPEGSIPLFIGTDNQANIGFPCTKTFRLLLFCYPLPKYLSIFPHFKRSYQIHLNESDEYFYILDFQLYLQHLTKGKFDMTYYLSSPDQWKHDYWQPAQWMELQQYCNLANRLSPVAHCEKLLEVYQAFSRNPLPILFYKLFQLRAILVTDRILLGETLPSPNLIHLKQHQSCEPLIDEALQTAFNPKENPSQTYILNGIDEFIGNKLLEFQRKIKTMPCPNISEVYKKGDKILTELLFDFCNKS